jgi:hypothetical protein
MESIPHFRGFPGAYSVEPINVFTQVYLSWANNNVRPPPAFCRAPADAHYSRWIVFPDWKVASVSLVADITQIVQEVVVPDAVLVIDLLWPGAAVHEPDQAMGLVVFAVNHDADIAFVDSASSGPNRRSIRVWFAPIQVSSRRIIPEQIQRLGLG